MDTQVVRLYVTMVADIAIGQTRKPSRYVEIRRPVPANPYIKPLTIYSGVVGAETEIDFHAVRKSDLIAFWIVG